MSEYTYRRATPEDLRRLWDDNVAANADDPRWQRWRDEYLYYHAAGMACTYTVLCDDEPVGEGTLLFSADCSAVGGRTCLADGCTIANINALRIRKAHEGQGHISALVKMMTEDARRRGYARLTIGVEAENVRNCAIYRHWGFVQPVLQETEDGDEVLYFAKDI